MALVDQVKNSGLVTNDLFEMETGGRISAIVPKNFTDILNMSEVFYQSKMAPNTLDSASKIAVAIQYGMELGLPPVQAMQNIAVVNGRPCLWGDALPALMYKHGHQLDETIEGEGDEAIATCTLTRGDTGHVITKTFSVKDAQKAGLWQVDARVQRKGRNGSTYEADNTSPWYKYPKRMLQMRARSWAIRDGASDAMVGLAVAEEVQDYEETAPVKNITPPSPPSPKVQISKGEPAQLDIENVIETFDTISKTLDSELSLANDVETLKEIWEEFCTSNSKLSDDEMEELNNTLNEHIERVG